jgi:single-strand DNA-binding protein
MASYNKVMLIGNLTRDPEVRYTPKGQRRLRHRSRREPRVQLRQRREGGGSDLRRCGALGRRWPNSLANTCTKAAPSFIEGRLQMDSWEDKATGQKRTRLKVVGEQMQFLGSPQGSDRARRRRWWWR